MNETHNPSPGIEVQEQALGTWELGFLAGVFAAWGIRTPGPGEMRDAMKLLMAQREEPEVAEAASPELRLLASNDNSDRALLLFEPLPND